MEQGIGDRIMQENQIAPNHPPVNQTSCRERWLRNVHFSPLAQGTMVEEMCKCSTKLLDKEFPSNSQRFSITLHRPPKPQCGLLRTWPLFPAHIRTSETWSWIKAIICAPLESHSKGWHRRPGWPNTHEAPGRTFRTQKLEAREGQCCSKAM